jgi:transcriptional regulator of NAD metabolism
VLTAGVHLHTIEAPTAAALDEIVAALREAGFLVA